MTTSVTTPVDSVDDAREDAAITGVIRTCVPVLVERASRDTLNTMSPPP